MATHYIVQNDYMPPKIHAEPTERASQHCLAFEDCIAGHCLDEAATFNRFRLTLGKDSRLG